MKENHHLFTIFHCRILSQESTQPSSSCCGTRCPPALPPRITRTRPTCSACALGRGRKSTALTSSLQSSLTLASVAPLTCRIISGIQTTAGSCRPCRRNQKVRVRKKRERWCPALEKALRSSLTKTPTGPQQQI